eukprot:TRINITY_DN8507_c0_g1_i3.p1 TRINITY_DN8507_c0_g1~~TRINITY_DN8507_c0_g1_i3.p1  ORF type:complete len:488 (-),score=102.44 TRINITY_DN8507_c0_g1_i3:23-1486(-)
MISQGTIGNILQWYHFPLHKVGHIMKLPKFEVEIQKGSILEKQDIVVAQIYYGLFCIYINRESHELVLYLLSKEKVSRKVEIDLVTPGMVNLSIVDNLLISHNIEHKISMVFDIKLPRERNSQLIVGPQPEHRINFPVAGPLPISNYYRGTDQTEIVDVYDNWLFCLPSFVLDTNVGKAWELNINLETLSVSFSDRHRLVEFLLRRDNSKRLLLDVLTQSILEKESLNVLSQIFDMLNRILTTHYSEIEENEENQNDDTMIAQRRTETFWRVFVGARTNDVDNMVEYSEPNLQKLRTSQGYMVITQEDFYNEILLPVEDAGDGDNTQYLFAVVVEYIRSLEFEKITVQSFIYEFVIDLLVRHNRFYQLHQFLQYHVVNDSLHVACQLLSLSKLYPPTYQLALDMLKRLGGHNEHILEVLLTKGFILQALRFVNSEKKLFLQPRRFYEAALLVDDPNIYFTVYHFFRRRNLDEETKDLFQQTYTEYFR